MSNAAVTVKNKRFLAGSTRSVGPALFWPYGKNPRRLQPAETRKMNLLLPCPKNSQGVSSPWDLPVPTIMKFFTHSILLCLLISSLGPLLPQATASTAYQRKLLRLHNEEREKRNKPKLRLRGALNRSAVKYAKVMNANNHFDHVGPAPGFSTFDQRINDECSGCFTTMAENIALGQRNEVEVTRAWMKSPGHRRNILNRNFRFIGFGRAGNPKYWVANFGG